MVEPMIKFLIAASAVITITSAAQAQPSFQISAITAPPMALANLCTSLGGSKRPPALTIHHSKIAGVSIIVRMFDDTSRGSHINHGQTIVLSNASGETKLNHAFIPPCNTTGQSTSNYSIAAEAKGSKKQIIFGRYNSATKRVF